MSALPLFAGDGPGAAASAPPPATLAGAEKNPMLAGAMSAVLPCTGQWYNGELWTWKSGAMAAIEAGSIFVLAFFAAGGAGDDARMVCMAGAGGMIANHAWSAWDAWNTAKKNQGLALQMDKNRTMVSYNIPF